ncbi:hypothetical protein RDI58_016151 [Solanum bulbocastanum]|uniref:Reverse transcriptase zinc-binding domain-containing protein n=1 Tax=Solanum bulbocastanum TaxID=147425 RepID=A0AAN8TPQ5_SOLBU
MWCKDIHFEINFLVWRIWKGRIATEDNLKRMKVNIASTCYCCEIFEEETIAYLFLTSLIAQKLCRKFATYASVQMQGGLKQMIQSW